MATSASPGPATAAPEEKFALTSSRHFRTGCARTGASLAFTTYQAGKVFLIGLKPDGRLSVFERTFARCMGLGCPDGQHALDGDAVSSSGASRTSSPRATHGGYDAVYTPMAWIHDRRSGCA